MSFMQSLFIYLSTDAFLVHSLGEKEMSTSLKKEGRINSWFLKVYLLDGLQNCHLKFDKEYCARLRRQREKNTRGNGTKKAITQGCADIFFEISQSSKDRVSIRTMQVL